MSIANLTYKQHGFINFVTRWQDEDGDFTEKQAGAAPVQALMAKGGTSTHYHRSTWSTHLCTDGTKTVKVYYTEKKASELRTLMNTKLKDAVDPNTNSRINGAMQINNVDNQYGTSIETHGEYKMGDLFNFNMDDYSLEYQFNYNWWNWTQRLKDLGLLNADMTMDNPFGVIRPSKPFQIRYHAATQVDKRAVCVNFPGDVTTYNDYDAWNQKAYFIETDTEELTINKLGTHDTIVPINTFVVEGLNSGPDIPLEYGQPVLLSSASRKIKAGHRGIILHVWK